MLVMKIITLVEASLIGLNWIIRWVYITHLRSFAAFMMMWYVPGLIAIAILVEFSLLRMREHFYILNFAWGKGLLSFLLALLLVGPGRTDPNWNDGLTATILIIISIIVPFISLFYRTNEVEQKWI